MRSFIENNISRRFWNNNQSRRFYVAGQFSWTWRYWRCCYVCFLFCG